DCRRREIAKKLVHGRNSFRGLILELIGGVIFVAEKFGALGAELRGANHNIASVELATFAVAGKRCLHDPLAQWSILQRAEQWLAGRVLHLDDKLSVLMFCFGSVGDTRHLVIEKTGEIF